VIATSSQFDESNTQLWKLALEASGAGAWDWNLQTGEEIHSQGWQEMLGYSFGEIESLNQSFAERVHPEDAGLVTQALADCIGGKTSSYSCELRMRCKDGSWKWILSSGMVVRRDADGHPLRMIGTHLDIHERKEAEALVRQQAYFDPLTNLPNRRMMRDRLEQEIKRNRRDGRKMALLLMDLDHFKEVNDTLGHDAGDVLLVEASRRLRACVREHDTVARMGGDEFTLLITSLDENCTLEPLLHKLLEATSQPFELQGERVFISASIGVAMHPDDGADAEVLYKSADQAMYEAKALGRNRFSFFTPALQEATLQRARITQGLHEALEKEQFELHYQPIVDLSDGSVHKVEALIRWRHPERGLINPADFVPIAEASDLIVDMGDWVFEQVVALLPKWRRTLHPNFQVSINSSPVQFRRRRQAQGTWTERLRAQGLPGVSLVVEITEGLLLKTDASVTGQLLEWRDAGVQVALDDFGTGYSSMAYLQKLDIDFIKIDQSFVQGLTRHSTQFILCRAMVVMAHAMGLKVMAEGVETGEQLHMLQEAGCDYAQGFYFSRPVPVPELEALLKTPDLAKRWLPTSALRGMQILIIDDHPIMRQGMMAALKQLQDGVEVLEAGEGAQGLAMLEAHPRIKAVVVDLDMRPMGGIATIRQIRLMQPALPVLVVSGSEEPADYQAALRVGANGYCPKSSGLVTMRHALRQILNGSPYVPEFISTAKDSAS
jgi:diguanylate cyclase (GGDEF)-like protein/PAS domain S-box-containing protein